MSVELVFIKWPAKKVESLDGLTSKEAVDELKELINKSDLDNIIVEIPNKDDENFPMEVKSGELNTFLHKYSGKKVLFISNKDGSKKTATFR